MAQIPSETIIESVVAQIQVSFWTIEYTKVLYEVMRYPDGLQVEASL